MKGCGGAIEAVQRGGGASEAVLCLRLIRLNLRLIIEFLLRLKAMTGSDSKIYDISWCKSLMNKKRTEAEEPLLPSPPSSPPSE